MVVLFCVNFCGFDVNVCSEKVKFLIGMGNSNLLFCCWGVVSKVVVGFGINCRLVINLGILMNLGVSFVCNMLFEFVMIFSVMLLR